MARSASCYSTTSEQISLSNNLSSLGLFRDQRKHHLPSLPSKCWPSPIRDCNSYQKKDKRGTRTRFTTLGLVAVTVCWPGGPCVHGPPLRDRGVPKAWPVFGQVLGRASPEIAWSWLGPWLLGAFGTAGGKLFPPTVGRNPSRQGKNLCVCGNW
ncbi:hypothetical protein B0T20DRAFT_406729 [Sordaria brevicollis]|uniref:Uncharacterized protein n=1 Tax=Sordaria brevicollis TaxID=83679 RepID=A0AAE0PGV0_SORBR|nr:hypothetical protein B0T20DRAFT_406729 [Sordaria brevicollis]